MRGCVRSGLAVTVILAGVATMFYGSIKSVEESGSSAGLVIFLAGFTVALGAVAGYCYSGGENSVFQPGERANINPQGRGTSFVSPLHG